MVGDVWSDVLGHYLAVYWTIMVALDRSGP